MAIDSGSSEQTEGNEGSCPSQAHNSPVDEGWNTLTAVFIFSVLKRIQTPHSLFIFILGFLSR